MKLEPLISTGCVTVAELKRHIANWPEVDRDGFPTEVWIQTGDGFSRACVSVDVLNRREMHDGSETSDLHFSYE